MIGLVSVGIFVFKIVHIFLVIIVQIWRIIHRIWWIFAIKIDEYVLGWSYSSNSVKCNSVNNNSVSKGKKISRMCLWPEFEPILDVFADLSTTKTLAEKWLSKPKSNFLGPIISNSHRKSSVSFSSLVRLEIFFIESIQFQSINHFWRRKKSSNFRQNFLTHFALKLYFNDLILSQHFTLQWPVL